MATTARIDEIVGALMLQSEESHAYFHVRSGNIEYATDEELNAVEREEPLDNLPSWQQPDDIETAKKVLDSPDYRELPSQFEIHEYAIMERFCLSLPEERLRDSMYSSIKGSGAFGRFKHNT